MKDGIYTVDQVAGILELHPKTVRRFIQEGRLKARKVGKKWLIREDALQALVGDDTEDATVEEETVQLKDSTRVSSKELENFKGKVAVSAVVDVFVSGQEEAFRLSNTILAVMNSKDPAYGNSRCDYRFYEKERKARFILWGSPAFVSDLLSCISQVSEEEG